jgi:molybdopterin synthase catalytic subunit
MGTALVTGDPIRTGDVLGRVGDDRDGAVLLFLGVVRDHHEGRPVTGITYEAYEGMVRAELERIIAEAEEILTTDRIHVVHRVGDLEVGDISVAVAVSSPHRDEAYRASRYVMEEIKRRLPIWKKERHPDGASEWVSGVVPGADR